MTATISPLTPGGEPEPEWSQRWRRQRRWILAGVIAGVVVAIVVGGFVIRVPKVAFRPGGVQATSGLVVVQGTDTFESNGEIFYTTVQIPRLTLWEWLWFDNFDDAVDVFPEEDVFGAQTPLETQLCNAQMMRTSKSSATLVALDSLGYEPISPSGAVIERVFDDTPADRVLACGDVIVAVGTTPVTTSRELRDAVIGKGPGEVISVEVEDFDGGVRTEEIVLGDNGEGDGFLGVSTGTRFDQNELPFDVAIDTGDVGGPSAGLAFTLAILDTLTEGDLTGGAEVAVTGTIRIDGSVGPVGGIRQKVIAADRAGADRFLFPVQPGCEDVALECPRDEIYASAGDMELVEVSTLDEALTALRESGGDPLPPVDV
ncbi:MAG: PDZ domain-containing protein [Acidimicrobiia bacterium]|nr:PDZ domain-containing protein [Acidimicrobiia bacterium]MDH5238665.1 PDZ domain-containing protein [Acidimicrobiia bacterium]